MRKLFACILLLCFLLPACAENKSNCTLYVNDEEVENDFTEIDYENNNANLPLITIIEALGGETHWLNNNYVVIKIYGDEFVLHPEDCTLWYLK